MCEQEVAVFREYDWVEVTPLIKLWKPARQRTPALGM
jgi:hypothetical protein